MGFVDHVARRVAEGVTEGQGRPDGAEWGKTSAQGQVREPGTESREAQCRGTSAQPTGTRRAAGKRNLRMGRRGLRWELLLGPRGREAGWRVPRTIFGWPAPLQIPLPEGPRDEAGSRRGRIEPSLENRLAFLSFRPVTNGFLKDRLDRLLDPNSWR